MIPGGEEQIRGIGVGYNRRGSGDVPDAHRCSIDAIGGAERF